MFEVKNMHLVVTIHCLRIVLWTVSVISVGGPKRGPFSLNSSQSYSVSSDIEELGNIDTCGSRWNYLRIGALDELIDVINVFKLANFYHNYLRITKKKIFEEIKYLVL